MANLAGIVLKVSTLRFPGIGSIYLRDSLPPTVGSIPIPSAPYSIGPIISWPFFGSSRGLLPSLNRGPFKTTEDYLEACAQREIADVIRENEGRVKGKRPMRRPSAGSSADGSEDGDVATLRSHLSSSGAALGHDHDEEVDSPLASPTSSASSLEFVDPEDTFYRDYRASQRSTYLVAHTDTRESAVRSEMMVAFGEMGRLLDEWKSVGGGEFGVDLHDLSRENVFVDENDHSRVVGFLLDGILCDTYRV